MSKAAGAYSGDSGVLENKRRELVMIDEMQCGFMPGKGTTYALFIMRRMQEEFRGREKVVHVFCRRVYC